MENKNNPSPYQECLCKNCGKHFAQYGKGRPRVFCTDRCRRAWGEAHSYKVKRPDRRRRKTSGNIYLRPVFREVPDTKRLCRAIIAMALETKPEDLEKDAS